MASPGKFLLPSPNFGTNATLPTQVKPHYLTPSGMTLHKRDQPPPMYGKRGATTPAKFLQQRPLHEKSSSGQEEPRPYCEACDMELQCADDLRRHCAQHERCPVDGCSYRGLSSVMDKHVAALHASGLFGKFKKLSTPEEIAAWRAERKQRYPTVANVEMRQRAQEQRMRRGERLVGNRNRFGKQEDRRRANTRGVSDRNVEAGTRQAPRERRSKQRKQEKDSRKRKAEETVVGEVAAVEQAADESDSCLGVRMFKGTSQLSNYTNFKSKKPKEVNVLSNLLGMYGSDEEDEETMDEEKCDQVDEEKCEDQADELRKQSTELNLETTNAKEDSQRRDQVETEEKCASSIPTQDTEKILASQEHLQITAEAANSQPTNEQFTIKTIAMSSDELAVDMECVNPGTKLSSDDEAPEEAPIARTTDYIPPAPKVPQTLPPTDVSTPQPSKRPKCEQKPRSKPTSVLKRKSGLDYRKARLRKQNTMLEKLLEPDIRHERNVLLQCVRFVCENDFFGIGEKPATAHGGP